MNEIKKQYKTLVINGINRLVQSELNSIATYSYQVVDYQFNELASMPLVTT